MKKQTKECKCPCHIPKNYLIHNTGALCCPKAIVGYNLGQPQQELRGKIKKLGYPEHDGVPGAPNNEWIRTYNEALSDVLKLLEE